ncbi:MAG: double-strand break repair helicase AddA [Rhizobiaceae bacterium]
MSAPRYPVPGETLRLQGLASDPGHSAWVSANAGSGKTHVLAQRVIRLLLDGTDPSKILCLTYTRAAAANMSARVFSTLSAWTMLGDEALSAEILAIEGSAPGRQKLSRARKLFAEALETPGGLKIHTIHAFCEAVLHQFPLEANIVAHFQMLDARMEEALFAEARRELVTGATAANPSLGEAFATVLERAGEFGLDALLKEIVARRDGLRAFITALGGDTGRYALLFEAFGFPADASAEGVAGAVWPLPSFPPAYFSRFAAEAEATDARSVLNNILPDAAPAFAETDPVRRLALLASGFLKSDGEPYAASAFKKALCARLPDLPERYAQAASAIAEAAGRLALLRMLEGTRAALTVADWLIGRYEQLKAGRGFLDFNDLITRTVNLLARDGAGAWVQYKLDQGIDHILLDEAQDTSPSQWSVVRRLAEEFFAGMGARNGVRRTVFAVGDEKQSIYSFQGAVPEAFAETGSDFSARVRAAEAGFEHVRLQLSFRSTRDVLGAVDRVFATESARRGLSSLGVRHSAIRYDAPGYVELWPSVGAETITEPEDWADPVDHASAPAVRVAETVAATIRHWLDIGERIDGQGRRLAPGDIMVLVRKRDSFVHALSRSLKNKGVPVAGADRLLLAGHIAVKDMIALGRFLLQPGDDLSLAALLRSPVFSVSEEALYRLAAGRPVTMSLGASLRLHAREDGELAGIAARLDAWGAEAAFSPVFEFYSSVLARGGVRRRMIARLGPEAGDILDEFLSFCLAEERAGLPGLEAFLATLESAGPEIKREMDQGRDEVRIMTVHAAKGLEAPVVFLVDSGSAPFSDQHLPRLMPFDMKHPDCIGTGYLWRSGSDVANAFSRQAILRARDRADDEYRRLLYVGMTRAEDRLIVCGYHGRQPRRPTTWHALVEQALAGAAESRQALHPLTGEPVLRFCLDGKARPAGQPDERQAGIAARSWTQPPWFGETLAAEDDFPKPLSPSGASLLVDEPVEPVASTLSPVLDAALKPAFAIERGLVMHRLLQLLPDHPPEGRSEKALAYLARAVPDWSDADRRSAFAQAEAVLSSPGLSAFFAPGSRAEVSVAGRIMVRGRERTVAGTIDRLAVTDGDVLVLDYKTNRAVPADMDALPQSYVLQVALYRAVLAPLYPGRRIRAALLFTAGPRLFELPPARLDAALAKLGAA